MCCSCVGDSGVGGNEEESGSASDSDTPPQWQDPVKQIAIGIMKGSVSVYMADSIDGQDDEMILLHAMSGHEELPEKALIRVHANGGAVQKAILAQLKSYGCDLVPKWELSNEQRSIIASLSSQAAEHACTVDAPTIASPSASTAMDATVAAAAGAAPGASEPGASMPKVDRDLKSIHAKLLAGCTPSPLMNLAEHAMRGHGRFFSTILPSHPASIVALDLEELNVYGNMARERVANSLDIGDTGGKIGKLLKRLNIMGSKTLAITSADNHSVTLKLTSGGKDAGIIPNIRGKSVYARPEKRAREDEEKAAAPLRDIKAKRKAAKAAKALNASAKALEAASKAAAAVPAVKCLKQVVSPSSNLQPNVATAAAKEGVLLEESCSGTQPPSAFPVMYEDVQGGNDTTEVGKTRAIGTESSIPIDLKAAE